MATLGYHEFRLAMGHSPPGNPTSPAGSIIISGAPAYSDGYAALPLTRGLKENGMSFGAAMAFLVSGSIVSTCGAMAIFLILRPKPFSLCFGHVLSGLFSAGWVYEVIT